MNIVLKPRDQRRGAPISDHRLTTLYGMKENTGHGDPLGVEILRANSKKTGGRIISELCL